MIIHAIFVMCSRICKQEQKKKTQKSFSSCQSKLLSVDKAVLLSCYLNCNWKMTKSWHVEKKNDSLWIKGACFVDFKILSMPNLTKASFFDFCKEFFVLEKISFLFFFFRLTETFTKKRKHYYSCESFHQRNCLPLKVSAPISALKSFCSYKSIIIYLLLT